MAKGNIKNCDSAAEEGRIQERVSRRRQNGPSNLKIGKEVKTCVTELYSTNSDMSDSDFTFHVTDEFTKESNCEGGAGSIVQPVKPNEFVLIKLATKKRVKYFDGLIQ